MGQQEILELLEKNKTKWYSTKEIAEALNISTGSANRCCKILRYYQFVLYDPITLYRLQGNQTYMYKHKKDKK